MKLRKHIKSALLVIIVMSCGCTHNLRPTSSQLNARRSISNDDKTEAVFYLTVPSRQKFPIAVICEGSTSANDVTSVWQLHQFEQFDALPQMGLAVLTIEKDGIDADRIDRDRFFANYTRGRRFHDHVVVLDHLFRNPPPGFDGRLIFIGASECGVLANQLSMHYPQTVATINWSSSGYWPWLDELWSWAEQMRSERQLLARIYAWWHGVPKTREGFADVMAEARSDPSDKRFFLGMTYRYHADAMETPAFALEKIHAPLLVVCGTKDSLIESCDSFAEKARAANPPITYWRVEGMEHRISKNRVNIIPKSFEWLRQSLANSPRGDN